MAEGDVRGRYQVILGAEKIRNNQKKYYINTSTQLIDKWDSLMPEVVWIDRYNGVTMYCRVGKSVDI